MRGKIPIPSFTAGVTRTRTKTIKGNDKSTSSSKRSSRKRKSPTANLRDCSGDGTTDKSARNRRVKQDPLPAAPQCPPLDENSDHISTGTERPTSAFAGNGAHASNGNAIGTTSSLPNTSTKLMSYLSLLRNIDTVIDLQMRRSTSRKRTKHSTSTSTRNGITSNKFSMTLDKFMIMISKAVDGASSSISTKSIIQDLVIVYLVTASPELVQVHYDQNSNDNLSDQRMKVIFPETQNRLQLLSKLYKTKWKGWDTPAVTKLQQKIQQERSLKERIRTRSRANVAAAIHDSAIADTNAKASNVKTATAEAILQPGMTLEERIRARSQARTKMGQERDATIKSSDLLGKKQGAAKNSIHVLFADALHIHFRHASKRQRYHAQHGIQYSRSKISQNQDTKQAQAFLRPMPLNDVCNHLSGGAGIAASAFSLARKGIKGQGSGSGTGLKSFTKKEVKKVIYEVVDIVPEWIQIVSGKNVGGKKNSMVVLKNGVSYQMVREKLNDRVVRSSSSASTKTSLKLELGGQVEKKEETLAVDAKETSAPLSPALKRPLFESSPHPMKNQKTAYARTDETNRKSRTTSDLIQMARKQPPQSKLSQTKNCRIFLESSSMFFENKNQSLDLEYENSNRGILDDDAPQTPGPDSGLRVNYNQHMTDADYDGGLVLQSNSTNPRGLKRMFSQLNAGERI